MPAIVGSLDLPYFLAFSRLGISNILCPLRTALIKISISIVNPFDFVFNESNILLSTPLKLYKISVNLVLNNLLNKEVKIIQPEARIALEKPLEKFKS